MHAFIDTRDSIHQNNGTLPTPLNEKENAMGLSRRKLIGGLGAAAAATGAAWAEVENASARPALKWTAKTAADMPEPDIESLLLSRAAFGARPGELEHARDIGARAWIEEQLDYESIDDSAVEDELISKLPALSMRPRQILAYGNNENEAPQQLALSTTYRFIYSKRLIYQAMVEFWSDHFNIALPTNQARYLKIIDDNEVIRKHALGNFKELLTASAQSPAMLNYLDNDENRKRAPNENYAREIMELHTLGASNEDGDPYSETDVFEVAKCFTGWAWDRSQTSPTRGEFLYRDADHDNSSKTVLGETIPPGGKMNDALEVINRLCDHPATGRFLATKLIRRFVTDDPLTQTPELVDRVAERFASTGGDIKEMLYTIFTSTEFGSSFGSYGGRLSRPIDLFVRALRVSGLPPSSFDLTYSRTARNSLYYKLDRMLQAMGHRLFYWSTPDGYPDVKEAWSASAVMLSRWNFGLALCGAGDPRGRILGAQLVNGFTPQMAADARNDFSTAGEAIDYWVERLMHREMNPADRDLVIDFLTDGGSADTPYASVSSRIGSTIALILDSPYFQWR